MTLPGFYCTWISPQRWCERIGIRPATQVMIGLLLLTASTLFIAQSLQLFPDADQAAIDRRSVIAQMAGLQIAGAVTADDTEAIQRILVEIARRFPEVRSIGVRTERGTLIAHTTGHSGHWSLAPPGNTPEFVRIPLFRDERACGEAEFCFEPLADTLSGNQWWQSPITRLMAFVLAAVALLHWIYLSHMLRELDPSNAVPERMQMLLDTMVEGAAILDHQECIVMANQAFAGIAFMPMERLIGRKMSSFPWLAQDEEQPAEVLPWKRVAEVHLQQRGVLLRLKIGMRHARSLSVNASPILSADGAYRGSLVTFSDQTIVEAENMELARALSAVDKAETQIRSLGEMVDGALKSGISPTTKVRKIS